MTPDSLTAETVAGLAAALGLGGDGSAGPLPARMATVNTLLNAAPSAIRERLMVEFLGLLQRPVY
jgi:sphinganine-1-phosphate aldolase